MQHNNVAKRTAGERDGWEDETWLETRGQLTLRRKVLSVKKTLFPPSFRRIPGTKNTATTLRI